MNIPNNFDPWNTLFSFFIITLTKPFSLFSGFIWRRPLMKDLSLNLCLHPSFLTPPSSKTISLTLKWIPNSKQTTYQILSRETEDGQFGFVKFFSRNSNKHFHKWLFCMRIMLRRLVLDFYTSSLHRWLFCSWSTTLFLARKVCCWMICIHHVSWVWQWACNWK